MAKATIQAKTDTRAKAQTPEKVAAAAEAATAGAPAGELAGAGDGLGAKGPVVHVPQPKATKLGQIRALLAAPEGATLAALCAATGWQSHSVRAALTGLRKAGEPVTKSKAQDGSTFYRIGSDAGAQE